MILSTNPESYTKRNIDAFNIEINFSKYLLIGETIASARVFLYDTTTMVDVSSTHLINHNPATVIDNKIVKYFIKEGQVAKSEYKCIIEIVTNLGNNYSADQYVYVID